MIEGRVRLSNKRRLEIAVKLLEKVSNEWKEEDIIHYPDTMPSFDEVVVLISKIVLKDR